MPIFQIGKCTAGPVCSRLTLALLGAETQAWEAACAGSLCGGGVLLGYVPAERTAVPRMRKS